MVLKTIIGLEEPKTSKVSSIKNYIANKFNAVTKRFPSKPVVNQNESERKNKKIKMTKSEKIIKKILQVMDKSKQQKDLAPEVSTNQSAFVPEVSMGRICGRHPLKRRRRSSYRCQYKSEKQCATKRYRFKSKQRRKKKKKRCKKRPKYRDMIVTAIQDKGKACYNRIIKFLEHRYGVRNDFVVKKTLSWLKAKDVIKNRGGCFYLTGKPLVLYVGCKEWLDFCRKQHTGKAKRRYSLRRYC